MDELKRFEGCLLGGAVGDALGYPVEFMLAKEIFAKYGPQGITQYELKDGIAQISDDTQMTLFTANGLILNADSQDHIREDSYVPTMYLEWLLTQRNSFPLPKGKYYSWLLNVPEMFSQRAPGLTCISELERAAREQGQFKLAENDSKGCGGVMRVAPFGLYFAKDGCDFTRLDDMAAESAHLTHGHELGYIPAAALAHIIAYLVVNEDANIAEAVNDALDKMQTLYVGTKHLPYFLKLLNKAVKLAGQKVEDLQAIDELGEGWVAEETLAIAVYCAIKYQNDFEKAIITSVNHDGDSDSTGSVTGNILGTFLSIEAIPYKFTKKLELKDTILTMADDLYKAKYERTGFSINDASPKWWYKHSREEGHSLTAPIAKWALENGLPVTKHERENAENRYGHITPKKIEIKGFSLNDAGSDWWYTHLKKNGLQLNAKIAKWAIENGLPVTEEERNRAVNFYGPISPIKE